MSCQAEKETWQGRGKKQKKKHSHLPRALYDFLLTWLWTTEGKNPQGIKWRGKKSFLKCIAETARMALLRVFGTSLPPITTESRSEVALWSTWIHFRSAECWSLGFVPWSGFWRTLPEPETVCASKSSTWKGNHHFPSLAGELHLNVWKMR